MADLHTLHVERFRDQAAQAGRAGELGRERGAWEALLGLEPQDSQAKNRVKEILRQHAEEAHRGGVWDQEIGAWQALLRLEPNDIQAQQRIPVAQHNQKYVLYFENAIEFAKTNNVAALKEQLRLLWHDAPYYSDPAGLAKLAGLKGPSSIQEALTARNKVESASKHKQQRKEFAASLFEVDFSRSVVWGVWGFAFCLLAGMGISIGMLSQSWLWAVGAVAALALPSYILGYRRTLGLIETTIILLISGVLVFGITWFLSTFQYDQPQVSHLWFGVICTVTLRHQVIFCAVLGVGLPLEHRSGIQQGD